jgi:hypothetical protein
MSRDEHLRSIYNTAMPFYLGPPVLTNPVGRTDLEVQWVEGTALLSCARPPRFYGPCVQQPFLAHNTCYLLDALHILQIVAGAGQAWRRITGAAPHWRPLQACTWAEPWVGRPWDWPDRLLVLPDPVYALSPDAPDLSYHCLTPLVPF